MIWKVVEDHPNYSVNVYGQVKNNKTGHIKNIRVKRGYCFVGLTISNSKKKWVSLHRIVAIAFIPNPENKREVNHKDGNKENCCIDNLEWNTKHENTRHAIANGLSFPRLKRNRPVYQYNLDGTFMREFVSGREAARELKIMNASINAVAQGSNRKQAGGFRWAFKDRVLPVQIL